MSPPPRALVVVLALALALVLAVALVLALALAVIWLAPPATNQAVIWLAHCHHIIMSPPPLAPAVVLALAVALALVLALVIIWLAPCHQSGSHLTCPLPPHHYVPTTPSTSFSASASASASASSSSSASANSSASTRELEIIEKFLCPHRVSFPLEVEFEFTTWAWVQATAETAFCGGHFYLYLQCLY